MVDGKHEILLGSLMLRCAVCSPSLRAYLRSTSTNLFPCADLSKIDQSLLHVVVCDAELPHHEASLELPAITFELEALEWCWSFGSSCSKYC